MEAFVQQMMSWYAIGGSYSQSVKGNPGIFEEPLQIKNITEFVKKTPEISNLKLIPECSNSFA